MALGIRTRYTKRHQQVGQQGIYRDFNMTSYENELIQITQLTSLLLRNPDILIVVSIVT